MSSLKRRLSNRFISSNGKDGDDQETVEDSTRDGGGSGSSKDSKSSKSDRPPLLLPRSGSDRNGLPPPSPSTKRPPPPLNRVESQGNLSVGLAGGKVRSKKGTLRRKKSQFFANYKVTMVSVNDGKLTFEKPLENAQDELDFKEGKSFDLFAIREMRLLEDDSCEFQVKVAVSVDDRGTYASAPTKTYVLAAETNEEALEWLSTLKHEVSNQVLVIEKMTEVLNERKKPDRAEPLYVQMVDALRVIHGSNDERVLAASLKYAKWLESQERLDESILIRQKAIEDREESTPRRRVSRRWSAKLGGGSGSRSSSLEPRTSSPRFSWRKNSAGERSGGGSASSASSAPSSAKRGNGRFGKK